MMHSLSWIYWPRALAQRKVQGKKMTLHETKSLHLKHRSLDSDEFPFGACLKGLFLGANWLLLSWRVSICLSLCCLFVLKLVGVQRVFFSPLGLLWFVWRGYFEMQVAGNTPPESPKTSMEGPKMMVWKRWLLLNMAIFGIYVKFLGGKPHPNPARKMYEKIHHPLVDGKRGVQLDAGKGKFLGPSGVAKWAAFFFAVWNARTRKCSWIFEMIVSKSILCYGCRI